MRTSRTSKTARPHRERRAYDADSSCTRVAVGSVAGVELVAAPHEAQALLLDELVQQHKVEVARDLRVIRTSVCTGRRAATSCQEPRS